MRSSSLLEDSQYQPFAGVYDTFMLREQPPDPARPAARNSSRRSGASTRRRSRGTRSAYLGATPYRLEEEKMAVILQQLVGGAHGSRFYPDFAGVARSHNFYPVAPARAEDGIAAVALGFGETVVERRSVPAVLPALPAATSVQFSSVA